MLSTMALGHNINCYTAVGYTITCQPKLHQALDMGGAVQYEFYAGATATQTSYGSFTWNTITMANGNEVAVVAYLGDTYIWQANPYQQLYYNPLWFCYRVASISSMSESGLNLLNGTTVGTWDQYSSPNDCYAPTPYQDYTTFNAY